MSSLRNAAVQTVLALSVCAALTTAATPVANAAAPADDAPQTAISIDASALGDAADAVQSQVDSGARSIFESNGLRVVDDSQAPQMVLTITPLGGDKPGYRCASEVRHESATVPGSASVSDCRLCTESELVETAQAAIENQLDTLKKLGAQPEPEPEPQPAADPVEPDPTTVDTGSPAEDGTDGGRGLNPLGKAGIAVAVVGVAALVPGIVMAVLPPKPLPDAKRRTTTLPGVVLASVGGAALLTGVALIVVDVTRSKKKRSTTLAPAIGPAFTGLSLRGRF